MWTMVAWVAALCVAAPVLGAANLVRNPSFEADADGNGVPDEWRWAGDTKLVKQTLALDKGRDGKRCARLTCTRFKSGTPAAHAMLCQMGVPVRRGKVYRVRLWARGKDIAGEMASIALSDTSAWRNCGLQDMFAPSPEWQRHEFVFRAKVDCPTASRFQIWYGSTGTLWVDDVEFEEAGTDLYRPGQIIAAGGRTNVVPNASFECGTSGWGSAEWDRATHWGGRMNRLFGALDTAQAFHGQCSLRIDLSENGQPVSFFDYYDLHRTPVWAPLAANIGFIEVEPGKPYTLSVMLKAREPDTPARLAVRQFMGGAFDKAVRAGADWARHTLTFTPSKRWCYVLAGPDLRETKENPKPPKRATLWLDAVQLERGEKPTAFGTRDAIEFAVSTDKLGNVFAWDEPLSVKVSVANSGPGEARAAQVELWLEDFFGKHVWRRMVSTSVPPGTRAEQQVGVGSGAVQRGFFRLHARLTAGDVVSEHTMRLAVIPVHQGGESRFGVNHAYPWPHLLDLCGKAGLVWVRDWSLKWKDVEPEKGRFTFAAPDQQIDRPLRHGLSVLAMLPFPSSEWSSTAPAEMRKGGGYRARRAVVAMAPRDMGEFENYVGRTVAHYRGRVTWWQVFNEPLFTSYALPRKHGYDGGTYARYTKAFVRAARKADPQCKVLAGIGYLRDGQILDDFAKFFEAGGLEGIDAVDIHHYPRIRPPEFAEPLLEGLNALMDKHGGRKPIWLTEYGYYADDEPWAVPMPSSGFNRPLASESLQCAYAVRWATLMLANGVDKVFYHAGTCDGVNSDSLQGIFYEYGGQPHKIYAAQAVMSHLFTPACRFVKRLALGQGAKGYLFRDGGRLVAVVWAPRGVRPKPIELGDNRLRVWDIMGRPQKAGRLALSGTPLYVLANGVSVDAFVGALR